MKITKCEVRPQYQKSMGKPYVFLGGCVDLEPWNENQFCVGNEVTLGVERGDGSSGSLDLHLPREFTIDILADAAELKAEWLPEFAGIAEAIRRDMAPLFSATFTR